MRLLAWFVATVVYVWQEQKEFSFSQIQLAAFIGLQRRRGRGEGKVSQTPVKGGIVSSISQEFRFKPQRRHSDGLASSGESARSARGRQLNSWF